MRKELSRQSGLRKKFKATFGRIGKKSGYRGYSEDTILLNGVIDCETGEMITDHAWFTYTKGFEKAGIVPGDDISFEARVKEYKKGYVNVQLGIRQQRRDYKLSHPTRITKLTK